MKTLTNFGLLIVTYILPLSVFASSQDDYSNIETIQKIVFSVLFIGAALLTYLNFINIKTKKKGKWIWILFEIIGICGLVYSGIVLYLIFVFRHGIGF